MKARAAVLVSAIIAAGLAGSASAATKPAPKVCKLITDATGDVTPAGPSLDIVSGDVASDAATKKITAVIRVAGGLGASEPTAPTGRTWRIQFTHPSSDKPLYLLASQEPTGTTFEFGTISGNFLDGQGTATGVIDAAKNEVRITAPSAFDGLAKLTAGSKVTSISAVTQRRFVVLLTAGDSAIATKSYTLGAASCVAVGK